LSSSRPGFSVSQGSRRERKPERHSQIGERLAFFVKKRSSMAKSRKKRTDKRDREKKPALKPLPHAVPPPDNPQLRLEEDEIRRGTTGSPPGGVGLVQQAGGEARAIAERRLAALEQARRMPEPKEEEQAPPKEDAP
jgi:hypothetical protein